MFTLDEEDNETEYGESFKSSMKSTQKDGKIKFIKRIQDDEIDEDDDDDIDPDEED